MVAGKGASTRWACPAGDWRASCPTDGGVAGFRLIRQPVGHCRLLTGVSSSGYPAVLGSQTVFFCPMAPPCMTLPCHRPHRRQRADLSSRWSGPPTPALSFILPPHIWTLFTSMFAHVGCSTSPTCSFWGLRRPCGTLWAWCAISWCTSPRHRRGPVAHGQQRGGLTRDDGHPCWAPPVGGDRRFLPCATAMCASASVPLLFKPGTSSQRAVDGHHVPGVPSGPAHSRQGGTAYWAHVGGSLGAIWASPEVRSRGCHREHREEDELFQVGAQTTAAREAEKHLRNDPRMPICAQAARPTRPTVMNRRRRALVTRAEHLGLRRTARRGGCRVQYVRSCYDPSLYPRMCAWDRCSNAQAGTTPPYSPAAMCCPLTPCHPRLPPQPSRRLVASTAARTRRSRYFDSS